jgi:osmoprotectant transport system permease protein
VSYLASHPQEVAFRLGQHLLLTVSALVIALAIALPAGWAAWRIPKAGQLLTGALAAIYTIPSLALLALLVPITGLGFWTALIALVAYAQMILVRAVLTGLRGVPESLRDAGRGLGMTPLQLLARVEAPQALPVFLSGVRVAAVALIAIANLAAWIDAGGLGTLIFDGLRRDVPGKIVAGALASALLAIAADAALRFAERRARANASLT